MSQLREMLERLTMGRALIIGFMITSFYYFILFDDGSARRAMIQNSRSEVQRLQTEIQTVEERLHQAEEYQRAAESLGSSIDKLLSYIPADFTVGQLMKTVSDEARVAGLDITQMTPKNIQDPESRVADFTELGVSLQLKGQYDQLLTFMSNLTRQRQIFIFEKLDMTSDTSGPAGLISVNAEIHAFSYRGETR